MNIEEENALLDAYRDAIEAEKSKLDGIGADELRQIVAELKLILKNTNRSKDDSLRYFLDSMSSILNFAKSIAKNTEDIEKTDKIISIIMDQREKINI